MFKDSVMGKKNRLRAGRAGNVRRAGGAGRRKGTRRRQRVAYWTLATLVGVGAVGLFAAPYFRDPGADDPGTVVQISMNGFRPSVIRGRIGQPIKVTMVNLDNQFHTDGGGWHNFVVEDLDVVEKVGPKRTHSFTIQVDQPGVYPFYCDICCGGKENPFMQGKLIVT